MQLNIINDGKEERIYKNGAPVETKKIAYSPFFNGKYFSSLRNKKRYIKKLIRKRQIIINEIP